MSFSTISGALVDSDTTPWINALWSCIAVSPSSPPVFNDGTPVLPVFGQLSATGIFTGSIPRTDSILPAGTTLTITVYSVTSAPPSVIENVVVTTPTINLGALLSPQVTAPRIQSAPIAYAYSQTELLNPTHGDGFVNTSANLSFVFIGNTWEELNAGPSGQIYPPAGIAVSTGSAWANSILPGALPAPGTDFQVLVNQGGAIIAAPTTFEGNNGNVPGELNVGSFVSLGNAQVDGSLGVLTGITFQGTIAGPAGSFSGNVGATTLASTGNTTVGGNLGVTGSTTTGTITSTGNAQVNGALGVVQGITASSLTTTGAISAASLTTTGAINSAGTINSTLGLTVTGTPAANVANSIRLSDNGTTGFIDVFGPNGTTQGNLLIRTITSNASANTPVAQFASTLISLEVNTNVTGTLTATTKSFKIPHPLDATKDLIHGCLEGPEIGVYYRGEAETDAGRAEITLPDYFEALTSTEGRSVLLTQLYQDDDEDLAMLAATRVIDGKFRVRSSSPTQKFYWEVKAVRRDVGPLQVEPTHEPPPT